MTFRRFWWDLILAWRRKGITKWSHKGGTCIMKNTCRCAPTFLFLPARLQAKLALTTKNKKAPVRRLFSLCGEKGIRTPGPVARTTVFKTAAFDHSAISPGAKVVYLFLYKKIYAKTSYNSFVSPIKTNGTWKYIFLYLLIFN